MGEKELYHSEYKNVIIRTTEGSTLKGKVNISGMERVSDLFTKREEPFLVMVDVALRDGHGKTLFINKHHIVWVEPDDE